MSVTDLRNVLLTAGQALVGLVHRLALVIYGMDDDSETVDVAAHLTGGF